MKNEDEATLRGFDAPLHAVQHWISDSAKASRYYLKTLTSIR